jgi:hypothetical protein
MLMLGQEGRSAMTELCAAVETASAAYGRYLDATEKMVG